MNERIKELAEQAGIKINAGQETNFWWLERFAELVRQDEREAIKREHADALPPTANAIYWMDMVVGNLVRNGVNKHRARELAHHFYTYTTPQEKTYAEAMEQPTPKQSGTFLVTKREFKCTGCLGTFKTALDAQYHSCKDNK